MTIADDWPQYGIGCPACRSLEHLVRDSRPQDGYIRRRRVCEQCGERFTTHERYWADYKGDDLKRALEIFNKLQKLPKEARDSILGLIDAIPPVPEPPKPEPPATTEACN